MIVNKPKKKKKLSRYTTFTIIMGCIFTLIIVKLIYLQVYKHEDYKEKANTTSTKFVSENGPRGLIYDQDGNVLASNKQTYTITYTKTNDADSVFYSTVDSVLRILRENGENFKDDLLLKLDENNNWYIDYKSRDPESKRIEEVRFKRDRGLNEAIEKELYGDDIEDLSDTQISKVDEKLLEITPEEVFYSLVKTYDIISLVNPEPLEGDKSDYEANKKKYKDMSGKELTEILSEKYSYSQIRDYIVVKDAIKMQSFKGFRSVTIASNVNKDTAFILYQKLNDLPGIDVTLGPIRDYPYKTLASSVLGYLSKIDGSKQDRYELRGYDASTDLIGVAGIESAFEEQLKGVKGGTTVKVNSKGRVTEELFKLESYPGNNVHLTLDKDVQYAAEQSLKDTIEDIRLNKRDSYGGFPGANRGAVVVTEVNTGRILASASYPDYDPNLFAVSGQLTTEENEQYFSPDLEKFGSELIKNFGLNKTVDDLFPMSNGVRRDQYDLYPRSFLNYATQGLIPPGSTFKPLTAIAGLESGVVGPDTHIVDQGKFTEHADTYGDSFGPECLIYTSNRSTHGSIDVKKALEVSCNYYFYEVAYRLYKQAGSDIKALDSLAEYAWKFGLGTDPKGQAKKSTGIEIEENFGQVYNFESFKEDSIYYARFELAEYLESGNYKGINTFVPFDYSNNEDDSEKLKEAKKSLKDKIADRFSKIGTNEQALGTDEFSRTIIEDIKNIMKYSDKYSQNVKDYEASKNTTVDKDSQAKVIADVIARFVTNDKAAEIKSPAQEVFAAIGQGMNTFTPMQLAQYVSTIANGGKRYSLHYVDKITDPNGGVIKEYSPVILDETKLKESTLAAVKEGMKKVNMDESGTATNTFVGFPIETAGKTGTADFSEKQREIGRSPFATYVSFAPLDNPEIAVVAVVYDGGHGGYVAPVARAVYEAYFKEKLLEMDPNYASKSASFQKYVMEAPADNKATK
ncbi:penicillin-binding transpeptidase domain-containing protein [Clostridium paraputrificum]|uniref:penicillin-binding transpeptidase domain-containing protein n=1 Tax=Clostridium TaxID=1485 RepID=UPI003D358AA0